MLRNKRVFKYFRAHIPKRRRPPGLSKYKIVCVGGDKVYINRGAMALSNLPILSLDLPDNLTVEGLVHMISSRFPNWQMIAIAEETNNKEGLRQWKQLAAPIPRDRQLYVTVNHAACYKIRWNKKDENVAPNSTTEFSKRDTVSPLVLSDDRRLHLHAPERIGCVAVFQAKLADWLFVGKVTFESEDLAKREVAEWNNHRINIDTGCLVGGVPQVLNVSTVYNKFVLLLQ